MPTVQSRDGTTIGFTRTENGAPLVPVHGIPAAAERSVYVLLASAMLMLLFWQWRPLPAVLWSAGTAVGMAIGWTVFAAGFALVLLSTFLIDHFDLFGLRQVWSQFAGRAAPAHRFVTPFVYRLVRHPAYVSELVMIGAAASAGHCHRSAGGRPRGAGRVVARRHARAAPLGHP